MSASNIAVHTAGNYNFYKIAAGGKAFVIGGVPEEYSADYINIAASCDAAVLLTSNPEFTGGLDGVLTRNPDIEIYAGSACLRNIKAILNRAVNERLVKDNMSLSGIRFMVMPNLRWVDTIMAVYDGVLFSGEAFSGFDGSAVGLRQYFDKRLAVNKPYVRTAVKRLRTERLKAVYPAYGMTCPQGSVCESATVAELLESYEKWSAAEASSGRRAVVVYSSEYGFTGALAERASKRLCGSCEVNVYDVSSSNLSEVIAAVNRADMLAIGTNTINRNAPGRIWDVITRMDLMNKKGMPYFVFGSFGWAGDGIRLIDKTLTAMGMRGVTRPVDVLFKPEDKDMERMDAAVDKLTAAV